MNQTQTAMPELWADDLAVEELPAVHSASWLLYTFGCLPFQCYTTVVAPAFVNQLIFSL